MKKKKPKKARFLARLLGVVMANKPRGRGHYEEGGVWVPERTYRPPRRNNRRSNWSEPMGGSDADGNPITVSFGSGPADGETLLGDGDRSDSDFRNSANHEHYGSGNGRNNNGTSRGQYSGPGH